MSSSAIDGPAGASPKIERYRPLVLPEQLDQLTPDGLIISIIDWTYFLLILLEHTAKASLPSPPKDPVASV